MKPQAKKPILTVVAGLALLGSAGCSSNGADGNAAGTPSSAPASTPTSSDAGTASGTASGTGTYADGEYTGTGTYIPPSNQQEEVTVKMTLSGGTVTALEVTPSGNNPTSKRYQAEFTDGIQGQVVGKPIDGLDVGKVAGSSLTSQGFNKALEMIKEQASS